MRNYIFSQSDKIIPCALLHTVRAMLGFLLFFFFSKSIKGLHQTTEKHWFDQKKI